MYVHVYSFLYIELFLQFSTPPQIWESLQEESHQKDVLLNTPNFDSTPDRFNYPGFFVPPPKTKVQARCDFGGSPLGPHFPAETFQLPLVDFGNLKTCMRLEKRDQQASQPTQLNFVPFLEDFAAGDAVRPSSNIREGCKAKDIHHLQPNDPLECAIPLRKGEKAQRVRARVELREKEHSQRVAAMKPVADCARLLGGNKPCQPLEYVHQELATPECLESLALDPAPVHSVQMDVPLSESDSESEDEEIPSQNHSLVEEPPSVLDTLELFEQAIPAECTEVLSSYISLEREEVPSGKYRKCRVQVQTQVRSEIDPVRTPELLETVLSMHKLACGKYLAITGASIKYYSGISEEFRKASAFWDVKMLQRKQRESGVEIASKVEWERKKVEYSFVNGALVERGSCNPELFLSEYLAKLDNFTIADVEVLLQVDLNFRDQFLSWIRLRGSLVRRNIVWVL